MPVRVELIDEAVDDLIRYAETGNLALFLKKLIRLEEVGKDAGLPLGRGLQRSSKLLGRGGQGGPPPGAAPTGSMPRPTALTGWRKIVVGDRNWRIIFTMDADETVATVWVVGDRNDFECYEAAQRRVQALGKGQQQAGSLAAVMFHISEQQRATKRRKR